MKKSTTFILLLLLILLAWFGWKWYNGNESALPEEEEVVVVQTEPLIFDCASTSVTTSDAWPEAKAAILAGRDDDKILLLVGPYFDGEIKKKGGIRAHDVALLLADDLSENQIGFGERKGGDCEAGKKDYLHELRYKWVRRNDNITEHLDHVNIYYQFDSDEEVENENIKKYVDELAAYVISSKEVVAIIGHTDADGTDEYNLELGRERAEAFKGRLLRRGVPEELIIVDSKGRLKPIESNETPEGRQKNRRIEVRVN